MLSLSHSVEDTEDDNTGNIRFFHRKSQIYSGKQLVGNKNTTLRFIYDFQ